MTHHAQEPRHTSKCEWLTPLWIFEALGCEFDLDPCSPIDRETHVPARHKLTMDDDGLSADWHGRVWMNPPFGMPGGVDEWLERFYQHGNGIGIIKADTSTSWWHDYISRSPVVVMPKRRVRYINNNAGREKPKGGPGFGSALFSAGDECGEILLRRSSWIGMPWQRATVTDGQVQP